MTKGPKVVIDAQLHPGGHAGGIEQFVMGLVYALGRLDDGAEEYVIVTSRLKPNWLEPYLGSNQRIAVNPGAGPGFTDLAKRLLGPFRRPVRMLWRGARRLTTGFFKSAGLTVPESNGFYESLGAEVVHFPFQSFVKCGVPMIYNPHDLQHLHYPEFFAKEDIAWREKIYRDGCHHSSAIVAESRWVKDDIAQQYGIDPWKIYVIWRGSPTELYEPVTDAMLGDVRRKFRLPETFALYPAQTWAHKNHIRLLEAINLLRAREELTLNLVCTGRQNDFYPAIARRARALGLEGQVFFLGFVTATELRALYHLAQFVVLPSLFEGGGFPVLEAFREGTPVACSAVTSLREYGGDAVLLFDPESVESIATALHRMGTDANLRATLRDKGAGRIRMFTWERTARAYRALYRKVTGRPLSDEERHLLAVGSPDD